jgi:glycosyltransferase involved in cell wall biosynthesis
MVAQFPAPFDLRSIWQPNRGRAGACNAGILAAKGELLVLLDDDMEPVPEFVAAHARAHPGGSRYAVLGAAPVFVDGSSPPVVEYVASRFRQHMEKLARPDHKIGIRDIYTGNFSIRREVLLEVGLFDEAFKIYGNEDGELAIRLLAAGVQFLYRTDALAHQHYEKDFSALARDKMAQGRTSVVCALRHPESIPSLRIGTYRRGERKWRLLRGVLLATSRSLRFLPNWIIHYVRWLERHRSPNLQSRYYLALDYFYWRGVLAALQEDSAAIGRLVL